MGDTGQLLPTQAFLLCFTQAKGVNKKMNLKNKIASCAEGKNRWRHTGGDMEETMRFYVLGCASLLWPLCSAKATVETQIHFLISTSSGRTSGVSCVH